MQTYRYMLMLNYIVWVYFHVLLREGKSHWSMSAVWLGASTTCSCLSCSGIPQTKIGTCELAEICRRLTVPSQVCCDNIADGIH